MPALDETNLILSFEPEALERCYVVADILEEVYDFPYLEYGLIGLAARSRPFHVVATPLLAGQDVSGGSVYQSGHNVLSMRREISALSRRLRLPLILATFVHRHPLSCRPSAIDDEFLAGTFVDQVSTAVSFKEVRRVTAGDPHYTCLDGARMSQRTRTHGARDLAVEVEFSIAFSLIVNKDRDHHVYAVRNERCQYCTEDRIRFVPAELAVSPESSLSQQKRNQIRVELELEIAAKLRFRGDAAQIGGIP